jgi:hypothetical protein
MVRLALGTMATIRVGGGHSRPMLSSPVYSFLIVWIVYA